MRLPALSIRAPLAICLTIFALGGLYLVVSPFHEFHRSVGEKIASAATSVSEIGAGAAANLRAAVNASALGCPDTSSKNASEAGPVAAAPRRKDYTLTRELVYPHTWNNYIVVTWANWHYRDFVDSWVHNLRKAGCPYLIVGATDDKLLDWLVDSGIPAFSMTSNISSNDLGWGSKLFHKMMRERTTILNAMLDMGFDTIITDVDTAWIRNPIHYMERYPDADLLASSDMLNQFVPSEDLETPNNAQGGVNVGILLFRPNDKAKAFARTWTYNIEHDDTLWDQAGFNDMFHLMLREIPERSDNLVSVWNGSATGGILPVSIFCSGQTYKDGLAHRLGLKPYVVHTTFQESGTQGKRHRMREWDLWKDGPEYWTHPVGFVSFSLEVRPDLLTAAREMEYTLSINSTLPHFALVNSQLTQYRAALILAAELGGASTIMPRPWLGYDRSYYPINGRVPGSSIDLPFAAPLDLVFDLPALDSGIPNGYREHSFLEKDGAAALNANCLYIYICKDGEARCDTGDEEISPTNNEIRLLPRRSLEQLKRGLSTAFKKYKMLHVLGGMQDMMVLAPPEVNFYSYRMSKWTSVHCCVEGPIGHIWYDFFWDYPQHTDRHGRVQEGEWIPTVGP